MYDEDETPKDPEEQPDTRLAEEELPKPGSHFKPGQVPANRPATPANLDPNNLRLDPSRAGKKTIDETTANEPAEKPKKTGGKIIKELVVTVLVTAGIIFIINNFIFQAFYVSGSSMEPSFSNSDYLIISKFPLTWNSIKSLFGARDNLDIKRGDVLVFRYPNEPSTFFIKRAIGLPGERVTVKNGVVTIYNKQRPDGFVLNEDYIGTAFKTEGNIDEIVQPQRVFVMGDNRSPNGSYDSRYWGQLDQKFIAGIGEVRLLPLNTFKLIQDPDYQE
ncbi:signal peptidase I [Candidatus Saccharibacteria bacterium]|nr:signal peptidase I [Candidatus Saccharibacteria bacterium]